MSTFQSYLIIGNREDRENYTTSLAKKHDLDITVASADISVISPKTSSVSIEQIRQLKNTIFQKPLNSSYKLTIIKEAHTLTQEAQNALLKLLEEPPDHAIIILEAENKESILKTILSRTLIVNLPKNSKNSGKGVLGIGDVKIALNSLPEVDDSQTFIDEEIKKLYEKLKDPKNLRDKDSLIENIQLCLEAKNYIQNNVNPKFALVNLIVKIHTKN